MSIKIQTSFQKSIMPGFVDVYGVSDCVNFDSLAQAEMLPITINPKDKTVNVPKDADKMYVRFSLRLNNEWKTAHGINGNIWYLKLIQKFTEMYCEKFGLTGLATQYGKAIENCVVYLFNDLTRLKSVDIQISRSAVKHLGRADTPPAVMCSNEITEVIENSLNGRGSIDVELLVQADNLGLVLKDTPFVYCENNDSSSVPIRLNDMTLKSGICWEVINSSNSQKGIKMYLENLPECYEKLKLDKLDREDADFIIASFIKGGIFNFYADNLAVKDNFNLKHKYL